ncbi:MAG: monofunctional biosynthetic peptidoglycan transglycosylase [Pseudomonadota bacterium]
MAKKATSRKASTRRKPKSPLKRRWRPVAWLRRAVLSVFLAIVVWVGAYAVLPPPTTPYILAEGVREGGIRRSWVSVDQIAPVMLRAVVAAEDANFCLHWGFDMRQLRAAIAEGANRGASTLTQQTAKNVWLWHGRSWPRKALEAMFTPVVEALWSKRRILEVYLNVAEFDTGVFGVEAAAQHHFGVSARELSVRQASLLAAVLPNPKQRQALNPSTATQRRASQIADGAATIRRDGRSACFE